MLMENWCDMIHVVVRLIISDSEQRLPEHEVPSGISHPVDMDNDESNLDSYLV
jgi:hypothetical protein